MKKQVVIVDQRSDGGRASEATRRAAEIDICCDVLRYTTQNIVVNKPPCRKTWLNHCKKCAIVVEAGSTHVRHLQSTFPRLQSNDPYGGQVVGYCYVEGYSKICVSCKWIM